MKDIIIVRPEKCTGCNVCVRCCPAPEANSAKKLDNGKIIFSVDASKCIVCGECVRKCPHGARDYVDDTEKFMSGLDNERTVILLDPAIKTAYPQKWRGILEWFKRKSLLIYDEAFGADICAWASQGAMGSGRAANVISQHCTAVVNYIKIYQPSIIRSLAPVYSPAVCAAIYIKKYLKRNNPIAYISPCIAKKTEIIDTGFIDYNVTFKKLLDYFDRNDIILSTIVKDNLDYPYDDQMTGQFGNMLSSPGGLKDNILMRNPDVNVVSSSGAERIYKELDSYAEQQNSKALPDVYDVLSCDYGCHMGPGTGSDRGLFDVLADVKNIQNEIKSKQKSKGGMFRSNSSFDDKLYKKFDDELEIEDFLRGYRNELPTGFPTLSELEPIFDSMGKTTDAQRNFNCGVCGYPSCYDMAVAIFRGLNTMENCINVIKSGSGSGKKEIEELKSKCSVLSEKIRQIIDDNKETDKLSADACEKAASINSLLKNIIAFCGKKTEMDENSIKQMAGILETTLGSFEELDEDMEKTKKKSASIADLAAEIETLAESMINKDEKANK